MTNANENANELADVSENQVTVISQNDDYVVIKNEEGKFQRKAKFHEFSSVKAETKADKIWLMNVFEGSEDSANGLKNHVGKQIVVADIILRPYDRINEDSGQQEFGVLTYLITPEKQVFVTSSKSVYFTIKNIMDLFGKPNEPEWENITVKVGKEKGTNGDMIKIKMIG
jgi:hypothetical protein